MPNSSRKITFNPDRAMVGPFPTRSALKAACVPVTPSDPSWGEYVEWAKLRDIDPETGIILSNAYHPAQRQGRIDTFREQLISTENNPAYGATDILKTAFTAVAATSPVDPVKVMLVSTTRYNPTFDLREKFPALNIHSVNILHEPSEAMIYANLVSDHRPKLVDILTFQGLHPVPKVDVVSVDFSTLYMDGREVKNFIKAIADTEANHVVFSNVFANKHINGLSEWYGQRDRGGIIPARFHAKGELSVLMQKAGYVPVVNTEAEMDVPLDKGSLFNTQKPQMNHFYFIKKSALAPA